MLKVRYSGAKLWGMAVLCGVVVSFLLVLFVYPEARMPSWLGLLLNGDFGHYFSIPLLVLGLSITGFRAAWLGADITDAIVATPEGITVTTMWRSGHAAWSDVMQTRIVERRYRRQRYWYLVVDRRDAGKLELLLSRTELSEFEYYEFGRALQEIHLQAIRSPLVKKAPAPSAAPMATIPPAQPEFPTRPAFGRKGV